MIKVLVSYEGDEKTKADGVANFIREAFLMNGIKVSANNMTDMNRTEQGNNLIELYENSEVIDITLKSNQEEL